MLDVSLDLYNMVEGQATICGEPASEFLEWNLKGCLAIDREGSHNGIPQLCAFFSITNFIVIDEILPLLWYPEQVTKP